ncbi:glycosyltransferase family 2 protein [Roseomonas marmotae]|uniref:Glycosyltransferase n=1 Tax=Roseomonas marmotae TaxID=2768161 RepID=A0ABS3KIE4_9PROT|nr:glycosyltransferase [Roseomonas marmotae]MBO1076772.1 glycosyltransferase [Roseomonas marmotae]QTI78700.1 glycosyltransferase [Roseomonas marmotae]
MDVSVVCPVFNTPPELLRRAARSVLENAPAVRELILVDDASHDSATIAACQELRESDPRVVLERLPENGGPASARNHGIALARGEWIGFLDADDLWAPDRMAEAEAVLAEYPDAAWIGGAHGFMTGDGPWQAAPVLSTRLGKTAHGRAVRLDGPALTRAFIADFCMHLGAMLVRRSLLLRAGGFAEGLTYYEDFLAMAKLSVLAPLHYQPRMVYGWRRGEGGLTGSTARLAGHSVRMHRLAAADPLLRGFRRELRWAAYSARKGLALNNLLAGRRLHALGFALAAYATDPRELRDLAVFLRIWAQGPGRAVADGARYSGSEQFQVGTGP